MYLKHSLKLAMILPPSLTLLRKRQEYNADWSIGIFTKNRYRHYSLMLPGFGTVFKYYQIRNLFTSTPNHADKQPCL
jgi:hypothetical protein